jgi:formyltetrahydrofolate deformylase
MKSKKLAWLSALHHCIVFPHSVRMTTLMLTFDCPDRIGLLARITGFVAGQRGNFIEVNQYTDGISNWFLARFVFEIPGDSTPESIHAAFAPIAEELGARWSLRSKAHPLRTVLLVSQQDHCLADLLWRWRSGELNIEIPLVISNHETLRGSVEKEGIPFLFLPVKGDAGVREVCFRHLAKVLRDTEAELIVLCRYMQILPGWLCAAYPNAIINIHHSLLPAFAGADPYRRAYDRGVKLIGATCHYATEELDAGPIIHQEVIHAEHFHTPDDLRRLGRDCEKLALARGVRFHVEDRILVHGSRAIVFGD